MIVEAKTARYSLSERDAAQCVQYASVLGVRWCLITNGMTWVFYDSHATGSLKDKWIAEVRLDGDELGVEAAWAVLSVFSRESLVKPNPITSLLVERVVAAELNRPDSKAVMDLRRSLQQRFGERVSGEAVLSAIRRVFLAPATGVEARVGGEPAKDLELPTVCAPRNGVLLARLEGYPDHDASQALSRSLAGGWLPSRCVGHGMRSRIGEVSCRGSVTLHQPRSELRASRTS